MCHDLCHLHSTSESLAILSMRSKQTDAAEFLTVDEAARLVGLSHWTLRSWLQKGRLTKFKSASRTVVRRMELLELLKPKRLDNEIDPSRQRGEGNSAPPITKKKKLGKGV